MSDAARTEKKHDDSEASEGGPGLLDLGLGNDLDREVATAPGDLPTKLIVERARAIRGQFRHDNTIQPLSPLATNSIQVVAESGEEMDVVRAALFYTVDETNPDSASASIEMQVTDREWNVLSGFITRWSASIPAHAEGTVVRYRIGGWLESSSGANGEPDVWAQDGQGFWFRFKPSEGITRFAYSVEAPHASAPQWERDAVIYQIFLDRFRTGDPDDAFSDTGFKGIHGGSLEGVRRSLGYLQELGATCLWLSPLHPAETYHRYDSKDYNSIDPALGTLDDVRRLSNLGLRVLMDFVPSHVSWHHPAFLHAQRDKTASVASWFTFYKHPDRYRTFLDMAPYLPSLNTDDQGARQHLIDSAVMWLTECGVSGFRLDHAIGPSMDFWVAFRRATKEARRDSFTVGEATDTPDSLRRYRQKLDAILDFPLARALRSSFGLGIWDVGRLNNFLNAYDAFMESGPGRVSFLDNHDMDRFLFIAGNDVKRLKLAALCQFALQPTPTVYYGTEIGMSQNHPASDESVGGDAQVRADMIWDESRWDQDLLRFYRRLIAVRKESLALRAGERRSVHLDAERQTYAFIRTIGPEAPVRGRMDSPPMVAVFNLSHEAQRIELTNMAPANLELLVETGEGSTAVKGMAVEIEAQSAAMVAVGR